MPMIDLTLPENALSEAALAKLAEDLTTTLIEMEGAPDNEYTRALAWCFIDERPAGRITVGGKPSQRPVYRVRMTVPEGAPGVDGPLVLANRERLVKRVSALVLEAEGSPPTASDAARVWVQLIVLPDGYWGGFGMVVRMPDIASIVGGLPEEMWTEKGRIARAAHETAQGHSRTSSSHADSVRA
jgi:phenylpyruvate tautomerase PptA (4-oxalocrotonate tautomerase family)